MYSCYGGQYDFCGCTELTYSGETLSYWERSLFQRLRTIFKIKNLPKASANQVETDYDAFMYGLVRRGFLVMLETKAWGITFQPGNPYGFGLQFQPTGMTVATPYFQFDRPLEIGRECAVIKMTPDYIGIWDIVNKHAQELLYSDIAIRQSQLNARFAYVIAADSSKSKKSAEALMERLTNGEPGIVYDVEMRKTIKKDGMVESLPWEQFDRDLKQNFILPELLESRRTIITDFYREIGVPVPQNKKERVNVEETQYQQSEVFNRREIWKQCLEESLDIANRMYGTNLEAEFSDDAALEEMRRMSSGMETPGSDDNRNTANPQRN